MKHFARGDTVIGIMAHFARQPSGLRVIDTLVLVKVTGDREQGQALFSEIADQYRGAAESEWDSATAPSAGRSQ